MFRFCPGTTLAWNSHITALSCSGPNVHKLTKSYWSLLNRSLQLNIFSLLDQTFSDNVNSPLVHLFTFTCILQFLVHCWSRHQYKTTHTYRRPNVVMWRRKHLYAWTYIKSAGIEKTWEPTDGQFTERERPVNENGKWKAGYRSEAPNSQFYITVLLTLNNNDDDGSLPRLCFNDTPRALSRNAEATCSCPTVPDACFAKLRSSIPTSIPEWVPFLCATMPKALTDSGALKRQFLSSKSPVHSRLTGALNALKNWCKLSLRVTTNHVLFS